MITEIISGCNCCISGLFATTQINNPVTRLNVQRIKVSQILSFDLVITGLHENTFDYFIQNDNIWLDFLDNGGVIYVISEYGAGGQVVNPFLSFLGSSMIVGSEVIYGNPVNTVGSYNSNLLTATSQALELGMPINTEAAAGNNISGGIPLYTFKSKIFIAYENIRNGKVVVHTDSNYHLWSDPAQRSFYQVQASEPAISHFEDILEAIIQ